MHDDPAGHPSSAPAYPRSGKRPKELIVNTYVLVHGSWHGSWCWKKVVPLLRHRGHRVVAVDLPGHGEDHTPVANITLESYVDTILERVHAEAHGKPVTLVAHSMGGIAVTQAAERCPEALRRLVYVSAFLPGGATNARAGVALATIARTCAAARASLVEAEDSNRSIGLNCRPVE
jgi:pimeloyl-ACP methyl ester carboxylesterase